MHVPPQNVYSIMEYLSVIKCHEWPWLHSRHCGRCPHESWVRVTEQWLKPCKEKLKTSPFGINVFLNWIHLTCCNTLLDAWSLSPLLCLSWETSSGCIERLLWNMLLLLVRHHGSPFQMSPWFGSFCNKAYCLSIDLVCKSVDHPKSISITFSFFFQHLPW